MSLSQLDHLIYAAPDLESGINDVERMLGVRPVMGGKHRHFGTHNALVSLENGIYLEVLAPDQDFPTPERGILFGLDTLEAPRLFTWVMRSENVEGQARTAAAEGLVLGDVSRGGRENPDGAMLTWAVTDPHAIPLDGAVPFLIDWGNTPHPSGAAPTAGALISVEFEHPNAPAVRSAFKALDLSFGVSEGLVPRMIAKINTPSGLAVLS
jgi:hypothetical protein